MFGKTFALQRGPKVYRIAQQIAETKAFGPTVDLPEPVVFLPDLKLLLQTSVDGVPIDPALCEGDVELVTRVAQAMTHFHRSKLDLGRSHSLEDESKPLTTRAEQVGERCPHLAEMAWTLHDRLMELASLEFEWRNRPVHRDFYHDQVLTQSDRLAVLDLDDAAMSEPAVDIANFAAHLRLLGFQRPNAASNLLEVEEVFVVYAQTLDPETEQGLVHFLMATTFLRLAGIHVDREDGERIARRLLEAAGTTHRFGKSMAGRSGG